jgi:subtilase family serine protease
VANAQLSPTPASASVKFQIALGLRDEAGAVALAQSVSDPTSSSYGQYLTPVEWESRFSPAQSSVEAVTAWLHGKGIAVEAITPDRMTIKADASAATIESAFATTLGQFQRGSHIVRLANSSLKMPKSLAALVTGVTGVDQTFARADALTGTAGRRPAAKKKKGEPIPPPPGFRNASPCSKYYGQKYDTTDPPYGGGYPNPLPYAPCGYTPAQVQSAYGLTSQIAAGHDGSGATVAVVDAFASPTLFADAHEYSERNQPEQVLKKGQFSELVSKTFTEEKPVKRPNGRASKRLTSSRSTRPRRARICSTSAPKAARTKRFRQPFRKSSTVTWLRSSLTRGRVTTANCSNPKANARLSTTSC